MKENLRKLLIMCTAAVAGALLVALSLALDLYYRAPFYLTIPLTTIVSNLVLVTMYLYRKVSRRAGLRLNFLPDFSGNLFSGAKNSLFSSGANVTARAASDDGRYRPSLVEVAEAWSKVHSVVWLEAGKY